MTKQYLSNCAALALRADIVVAAAYRELAAVSLAPLRAPPHFRGWQPLAHRRRVNRGSRR